MKDSTIENKIGVKVIILLFKIFGLRKHQNFDDFFVSKFKFFPTIWFNMYLKKYYSTNFYYF